MVAVTTLFTVPLAVLTTALRAGAEPGSKNVIAASGAAANNEATSGLPLHPLRGDDGRVKNRTDLGWAFIR